MKCCCTGGEQAAGVVAPTVSALNPVAPSGRRRWTGLFVAFTRWTIPLVTLALVPKCPACVAGYVLLLTGVGVSSAEASVLRGTIIGVSVAALGYLAVRVVVRRWMWLRGAVCLRPS